MLLSRTALTTSVLVLLTACGGGGGLVDETLTRDDLISEIQSAESAFGRLETLPGTKFTAMPTSGSATFDGKGGLFIDPVPRTSSDDITVFGDAALTADFARGRINGAITNLTGVQGVNPATGRIFDVDGAIAIGAEGSTIGRRASAPGSVPNDATASFSGQLRTETDGTFDISGRSSGKFLGTNAARTGTPDAPRALVLGSTDPSIVRNGRRISGSFDVYGEN